MIVCVQSSKSYSLKHWKEDVREFAERHAGEGRASRSKTKEQAKEVVESDDDEESESEIETGKPRAVRFFSCLCDFVWSYRLLQT